MSTFIESIVDDCDGKGYGIKRDDETLVSVDGSTVVALEAEYDENDEVSGVTVFSNDVEVDTISYDSDDFVTRLLTLLAEELNV